VTVDLRCSSQARARDTSPTGTAVAASIHVLVDTPLPWPADLSATPLHQAVSEAAGPGVRVHGVVPGPSELGGVRVVAHVAGVGPFTGYRRHAGTAASADAVPGLVRAMLAGDHEQSGTDVLVCGHGARDRCCGSLGTALFQKVDLPGAAVWRSGHLGGHRFAPTAVVLPSGTAWAWLDDELLATIVERSRPPVDLIAHYRGSTAVSHPAGQVAEAAVFALVGWSWLDGPCTVEIAEGAAGATEWEVAVAGAGAAWHARVREIGRLPQPVCGSDEPGRKDDPVLELTDLVEERP
jgi:hypothetical protein